MYRPRACHVYAKIAVERDAVIIHPSLAGAFNPCERGGAVCHLITGAALGAICVYSISIYTRLNWPLSAWPLSCCHLSARSYNRSRMCRGREMAGGRLRHSSAWLKRDCPQTAPAGVRVVHEFRGATHSTPPSPVSSQNKANVPCHEAHLSQRLYTCNPPSHIRRSRECSRHR